MSRRASSSDHPTITLPSDVPQTTAQMQRMLRQSTLARMSSSSNFQRRGGSRSSVSSLLSLTGADTRRDKDRQQRPGLEPSYRMEPARKFPQDEVQAIISETLERYLADETYVPAVCKQFSLSLSELIKAKVKFLGLKRYKVIVEVHIGQVRGQTVRIASRFLWQDDVDNFASASFKNPTLFAVGTVYAVYQE